MYCCSTVLAKILEFGFRKMSCSAHRNENSHLWHRAYYGYGFHFGLQNSLTLHCNKISSAVFTFSSQLHWRIQFQQTTGQRGANKKVWPLDVKCKVNADHRKLGLGLSRHTLSQNKITLKLAFWENTSIWRIYGNILPKLLTKIFKRSNKFTKDFKHVNIKPSEWLVSKLIQKFPSFPPMFSFANFPTNTKRLKISPCLKNYCSNSSCSIII